MSSTSDLTTKARFMRNASPQAFDAFYAEFKAYTEQAASNLIMASDDLQLHQGYVRQCVTILNALEEAKDDRRNSGRQADQQGAV